MFSKSTIFHGCTPPMYPLSTDTSIVEIGCPEKSYGKYMDRPPPPFSRISRAPLVSDYTVYSKMPALGYRGKPLMIVWYLSVRLGARYHTHMHMAWKFLYGEISRHPSGVSCQSENVGVPRVKKSLESNVIGIMLTNLQRCLFLTWPTI